jgi:hypothetical protein
LRLPARESSAAAANSVTPRRAVWGGAGPTEEGRQIVTKLEVEAGALAKAGKRAEAGANWRKMAGRAVTPRGRRPPP